MYKGSHQETLSVHFFSLQLENCYVKDYWGEITGNNLQELLGWLIIGE